jgi:hypothetical protein
MAAREPLKIKLELRQRRRRRDAERIHEPERLEMGPDRPLVVRGAARVEAVLGERVRRWELGFILFGLAGVLLVAQPAMPESTPESTTDTVTSHPVVASVLPSPDEATFAEAGLVADNPHSDGDVFTVVDLDDDGRMDTVLTDSCVATVSLQFSQPDGSVRVGPSTPLATQEIPVVAFTHRAPGDARKRGRCLLRPLGPRQPDRVLRPLAVWGEPDPAALLRLPLMLLTALLARFRTRWLASAAVLLAFAYNVVPYVAVIPKRTGARPAEASYWAPALAFLREHASPDYRVEVVPTFEHWEAYWVPRAGFPLARGWYRQLDIAQNPVLYGNTLSPASYRDWLGSLGVR